LRWRKKHVVTGPEYSFNFPSSCVFLALFRLRPFGILATLNPQNPRALPLQGKNLVEEFKTYAELTGVLSDYAARIANSLKYPGRFPWPEKPRLPQAHKKKKKIRQGKRQRPPHQRGASSA
jgi:hypothetical protein